MGISGLDGVVDEVDGSGEDTPLLILPLDMSQFVNNGGNGSENGDTSEPAHKRQKSHTWLVAG